MSGLIEGEVFAPGGLVEYVPGGLNKTVLAENDKIKLVLAALDGGVVLPEHASPGRAVVFALEGEAVIVYGGREQTIRAGGSFCFERGGKHGINARTPFKMAVLQILE